MKILFLSIGNLKNLSEKSLYPDLLRTFVKNGNKVYAVCANEKQLYKMLCKRRKILDITRVFGVLFF